MGRLLKADFYKLLKSKSLYICTLISLAFAAFSIFILNFANKMIAEGSVEVTVEGMTSGTTMADLANTAWVGGTTLFVAIILSIFIGSEFNFGTIKNTATKGYSRINIFLSKWLASVITANVILIIFVVFYCSLAAILFGVGNPADGFWSEFFQKALLQLLVNTAIVSVIVTATTMIRNSGGAIAANICIQTFSSTVMQLAGYLLAQIFNKEVNLLQYLPSQISTNVGYDALGSGLVSRAVIVSIIVIAVSLIVGIVDFNKRDIK